MGIKENIETFQLKKGLTRDQAWELVRKQLKHDHRGFTYDSKTGKAKAV